MFLGYIDVQIPAWLMGEIFQINGLSYIMCCINEQFTLIPYDKSKIVKNINNAKEFYATLIYPYYAGQYFQQSDGTIIQNRDEPNLDIKTYFIRLYLSEDLLNSELTCGEFTYKFFKWNCKVVDGYCVELDEGDNPDDYKDDQDYCLRMI